MQNIDINIIFTLNIVRYYTSTIKPWPRQGWPAMYPKDEIGLKFTQGTHFRECDLFWLSVTKFLKSRVPKGSKVFFFCC